MEISAFPFVNEEEISHFYNDISYNYMDVFNESNVNGSDENNKRRRRNNEESDLKGKGAADDPMKKPWKDILTSLMLLDEEDKRQQELYVVENQQERSLFEANFNKKAKVMNDYYSQLQEHFAQVDDLDQLSRKRRRSDATAAAAVAVAGTVSQGNGGDEVSGQQPVASNQGQRRLWVKDRSKDWWEKCNSADFPEEEFKKAFRMSKSTFDMICEELESTVMKKNTMLRDAIPVRQRVAVCIWRLATGEPLRLVSKRFGLGISTCHKLVLEVCSAIKNVLMPKFLQWPDESRMKGIKDVFEDMSRIPNVGGSMYTTHIPIIAPKVSVAAYFNKRHTERNQKTSYSITVQGVVDHKGVFTDVCIGWPGSMSDDQVLEKSALYQRAARGLLKDVWVVGTSGFPLTDWLLVPYMHAKTWGQHTFNERIGEIQKVAKDAFSRLKGRWTCLQKRTEVKLQELPVVLGACCVLHNICEMRNEEMDPELNYEIFDDEMIPDNAVQSANASRARESISHKLLHHGLAGSKIL